MEGNKLERIKNSYLFVLIFAFLVAFLGIAILSWQYHKISEKEIPSLKETMEQGAAEDIVEKFMQYRIEKNENQAKVYLTENAIEQKNQGKFLLINNFKSFEILKTEKISDKSYRSSVKIQEENENYEIIEIIIITKILTLDKYYIDSIEIAG
ncbi:MAG: hypothetical protein WBC21_03610 [Minisyncoccales bacterium]